MVRICILSILILVSTFANARSGINPLRKIDYKNLTYSKTQEIHIALVDFFKKVERRDKYTSFSFLNSLNAYASGETCFFGGWPSEKIGGLCKKPWTHHSPSFGENSYKACGGDKVRCNPDFFPDDNGNGVCVSARSRYAGLTNDCEKNSNVSKASDKLNKNPDLLKKYVEEVDRFCLNNKSYDACDSLKKRIAEINGEPTSEDRVSQAAKLSQNKALDLLKTCEGKIDKDELDINGRSLLKNASAGFMQCHQAQGIFDDQVKDIEKLSSELAKKAPMPKFLEDSNKTLLENSLKQLHTLDEMFDLNLDGKVTDQIEDLKEPYSDVAKKSKSEVDSASVSKFDGEKELKAFKTFGESVNEVCKKMREEYEKLIEIGPRGPRLSYSNKKVAKDKINAYQIILQENFARLQKSSTFGFLSLGETFKDDVFELTPDTANKCAKGKMKAPFNMEVSSNDLKESAKDISEIMLDELEDISDASKVAQSGDLDDIEDELEEHMKYRPHIFRDLLSKTKDPVEQESLAALMCSKTLDIYNTDDNFKVAQWVGAGVSVLAAGILIASGVGAPIGAGILMTAKATAVVMTGADLAIGSIEVADANKRITSQTLAMKEGRSSTGQYIKSLDDAGTQKFWGYASMGLGAVDGAALAFQTTKASARASREIARSKSNLRSARASMDDDFGTVGLATKGDKLLQEITDFVTTPRALKIYRTATKDYLILSNKRIAEIKTIVRNSLLPDDLRLEQALKLKSISSLSREQSEAILKAHRVGDETHNNIFNYTKDQLRKKAKILKKAGFNQEQIDDLIRNGIAGKPPAYNQMELDDVSRALEEYSRSIDNVKQTKRTRTRTTTRSTPRGSTKPAKVISGENIRISDKGYDKINNYTNKFIAMKNNPNVDLDKLTKFYEEIGKQAGSGTYRAIDLNKFKSTVKSGKIEKDAYFNVPGDPPRVGHNDGFIFLKCIKNCDDMFRVADEPGGTQLVNDKPLSDFEVIIPDFDAARKASGL